MNLVLVPVDEVLYSHGNTLLPYLLACLLYIAEDSTPKRNQPRAAFYLEDQGILQKNII